MKAVLEFQFPEDEAKHRHAVNAMNYYWALGAVAQLFRDNRKYDGPAVTEDAFFTVLREYGVELGLE